MLAAASTQASQAAASCEGVPVASAAVSAMIPPDARHLVPAWRGEIDVRWLRERAGIFEKAFTVVVDRLEEREPEDAGKLRGEFQRALIDDAPGKGPSALAKAEKELLLTDPNLAAMYCMGLRDMVGEMGMPLITVPRNGGMSGR